MYFKYIVTQNINKILLDIILTDIKRYNNKY